MYPPLRETISKQDIPGAKTREASASLISGPAAGPSRLCQAAQPARHKRGAPAAEGSRQHNHYDGPNQGRPGPVLFRGIGAAAEGPGQQQNQAHQGNPHQEKRENQPPVETALSPPLALRRMPGSHRKGTPPQSPESLAHIVCNT